MLEKKHSLSLYALWMSALTLVSLWILATVFSHERVLNTDSSNFFLNLLNTGNVSAAEKRYSSVIPQLLPVLFMKVNASLQWVLWAFSVSYLLLYTLIFVILKWILHQSQVAVSLVLALLLGVSYSFYHPVTETHQAIAWSVLFYGCLASEQDKRLVNTLAVLSFFLALFSHPTAVFMLSFAVAWHYAQEGKLGKLTPYLIIFSLAVFSVLRSHFNEGNYDAEQYKNSYAAIQQIPDFFSWNSVTYVAYRPMLYFWPFMLLAITVTYHLLKKKFIQSAIVMVATLGFFVLAAATFYHGDSEMMMEKAYMPAFTMIAIAVTPMLEDMFLSAGILVIALLPFFIMSIIGINMLGNKVFKPRLLAIDRIVDDCIANQQYKVIGWQHSAPFVLRQNWWATSADVLVRSTIKKGKSVTLYMAASEGDFHVSKQPDAFLYVVWCLSKKTSDLNTTYFSLPNQPYNTINLSNYE